MRAAVSVVVTNDILFRLRHAPRTKFSFLASEFSTLKSNERCQLLLLSQIPTRRLPTHIRQNSPSCHVITGFLVATIIVTAHATIATATAKNFQISIQLPSLTLVVITLCFPPPRCAPKSSEEGKLPVLVWCSSSFSFSSQRTCSQASKEARVSRGMEETAKRRQCMWIGGGRPSM